VVVVEGQLKVLGESLRLPSKRRAKKRTELNIAAVGYGRLSSGALTERTLAQAVAGIERRRKCMVVAVSGGCMLAERD
jgi:hypothetical protein